VIAHRGASDRYPENTLGAFRGAAELGASWVELDVRRTEDWELVVRHDPDLLDAGLVVETVSAELPTSVPTLAASLELCLSLGLSVNVELKALPTEPDHDPHHWIADAACGVVAEVAGESRAATILVSSFDPGHIERVRARDPLVPTALLVIDPGDDPVALAHRVAEAGHSALHPWDPMVGEALVDAAHGAGLLVNVWTVDDPARMVVLADLGVDGIVTNVPDVAVDALGG
jgi:glycerophosphoryl diester phosphodiesterase